MGTHQGSNLCSGRLVSDEQNGWEQLGVKLTLVVLILKLLNWEGGSETDQGAQH